MSEQNTPEIDQLRDAHNAATNAHKDCPGYTCEACKVLLAWHYAIVELRNSKVEDNEQVEPQT